MQSVCVGAMAALLLLLLSGAQPETIPLTTAGKRLRAFGKNDGKGTFFSLPVHSFRTL
jgi:hypothetical protein